MCEPYVTPTILERTFEDAELAAEIEARYFAEGPGRRLKFRSQYTTEASLSAIRPRAGLPKEMAEEVDAIREGLLALRQNVVLLRDLEDPNRFYPVSLCAVIPV